MRLKNKKTGEIIILIDHIFDNYKTLAELNEEWEDYEEPDKYFWIDTDGFIVSNDISTKDVAFEVFKKNLKSIGNYFETKEEADKAVEKLKAWQRLKDKGFRFNGYKNDARVGLPRINWSIRKINKQVDKDLDLLFGGEE